MTDKWTTSAGDKDKRSRACLQQSRRLAVSPNKRASLERTATPSTMRHNEGRALQLGLLENAYVPVVGASPSYPHWLIAAIRNKAVYVALGVTPEGTKDILGL
jgi:hypothetical protein